MNKTDYLQDYVFTSKPEHAGDDSISDENELILEVTQSPEFQVQAIDKVTKCDNLQLEAKAQVGRVMVFEAEKYYVVCNAMANVLVKQDIELEELANKNKVLENKLGRPITNDEIAESFRHGTITRSGKLERRKRLIRLCILEIKNK